MWSWPVAHRLLHAGCCKQAILHTGCCTQATARRLLRTQAHAGIVPPADPEALACALVAPADPETRRHERAPHSLPHPRRPSRTRRDGAWCLACALDLAWVRGPHAPLVGRPSREDAIDALTGLSRHGPTMKREMGQTRDARCRHSKARPCFTGRPSKVHLDACAPDSFRLDSLPFMLLSCSLSPSSLLPLAFPPSPLFLNK